MLSNLPKVISKKMLPSFIVLNYGGSGNATDFMSLGHLQCTLVY